MIIAQGSLGNNWWYGGVLVFCLWAMPGQAQAQSVQCCNATSGDFSKTSSEAACLAKPGHVPATAQNMGAITACLQKAQEIAQEYMSQQNMGMPDIPNMPGMPDIPGMPNTGTLQTLQTPPPQVSCCHVSAKNWVGNMVPQACLAQAGHFPDTPDYLDETEVCRSPGGGGGASTENIEINITNGGFEDWNGDEPVGYMNFDGGEKAAAATKEAGVDMQTVFKSTDAHTGQYSLHLKARKMKLPPNVPAFAAAMAPTMAGGVISCGKKCASLSGGNPVTESASIALDVTDPGNYFCGVYKGSFVGSDQLWVNAGVYRGTQLVGGTNSGSRALNFISKNTAKWTKFKLPVTMRPGISGTDFNRASIELMLKPGGNIRALSMGQVIKVNEGTNVKIDSVRFCGEIGITVFKPEVISGQEISNEKELRIGAQTFVNLDNDDKNGKFDSDDKAMSKDDNELIKMVLSLPVREGGYVDLQLTAPDESVKIWEDARKTKAFEFLNTPTEVPGYLQEENGEWIKHLWIEGTKPSKAQKDISLEFTYSQNENGPVIEKDKIAVTVLGIESMEWIGQGNGIDDKDTLDADPNWPSMVPGKSLRVFPGKKVVDGKPGERAKDRVKLKVRLSVEPVEPINIYFRSFDIDDPTADKDPLDDEANADDNRGQTPSQTGRFPLGHGDVIAVDFDEIEEEFEFQVTMQPGDNFRIVGGGDSGTLMQLENDDTVLTKAGPRHVAKIIDKNIFKATNSVGESRVREHEKYVSDILTVWRYMYTEIDSMTPIFGNSIRGNIESFTALGNNENGAPLYRLGLSVNIYSKRPSAKGTEGLLNAFRNGLILVGKTTLAVAESTANLATVDSIVVYARHASMQIDESIEEAKFTMFDDDYHHGLHKKDTVLPLVPLDRLAPAFAPAYVLPRENILKNTTRTVPFMVNYYEDSDKYLKSIYAFDNAAYHKDSKFWVVYLLNAFQGIATEDGDGDGTGAIAGQADGPGSNSMGAAIYQASGIELEDKHKGANGWRLSDAVPHEIGHLFGGDHTDDGLMYDPEANSGGTGRKSQDFGDKSLDRIRRADNP